MDHVFAKQPNNGMTQKVEVGYHEFPQARWRL